MKTFNIVFISSLVYAMVAMLSSPMNLKLSEPQKGQKIEYDSSTLAADFLRGDDLPNYIASNSNYKLDPKKNLFVLNNGTVVDTIDFNSGDGSLMLRSIDNMFQITICKKSEAATQSSYVTFFYVNGKEAKKLFPQITEKYFRIRYLKSEGKIIFFFENKLGGITKSSYGVLNLKTMEFHRQQ